MGRTALVTGASAGIGAAACRRLVELGLVVVGCARNVDRIKVMMLITERNNFGMYHLIMARLNHNNRILHVYIDVGVSNNLER